MLYIYLRFERLISLSNLILLILFIFSPLEPIYLFDLKNLLEDSKLSPSSSLLAAVVVPVP